MTYPRCHGPHDMSKVRYPSAAKARKYARISGDKKGTATLRSYQCSHCGGWHITSTTQTNRTTR